MLSKKKLYLYDVPKFFDNGFYLTPVKIYGNSLLIYVRNNSDKVCFNLCQNFISGCICFPVR